MSTFVLAGIGVGVALVLAVLATAVCQYQRSKDRESFLSGRRRRNPRVAPSSSSEGNGVSRKSSASASTSKKKKNLNAPKGKRNKRSSVTVVPAATTPTGDAVTPLPSRKKTSAISHKSSPKVRPAEHARSSSSEGTSRSTSVEPQRRPSAQSSVTGKKARRASMAGEIRRVSVRSVGSVEGAIPMAGSGRHSAGSLPPGSGRRSADSGEARGSPGLAPGTTGGKLPVRSRRMSAIQCVREHLHEERVDPEMLAASMDVNNAAAASAAAAAAAGVGAEAGTGGLAVGPSGALVSRSSSADGEAPVVITNAPRSRRRSVAEALMMQPLRLPSPDCASSPSVVNSAAAAPRMSPSTFPELAPAGSPATAAPVRHHRPRRSSTLALSARAAAQ